MAGNRQHIIHGLRDGIPIAMGYFAVTFSLGIIAARAGLTAPMGFLSSFFTRASAGEYGTYTLVAVQAAYVEVIAMCLVANLRYMLMSAALSQKIAPGTSWFHRILMACCVTDEVFGISVAHPGYTPPAYTYSAALISTLFWASGCAVGIVAGSLLPQPMVTALSMSLYGMFLAIIIPPAHKDRNVLYALIASFVLSGLCAVAPVIGEWSSGMRTVMLTIVISAVAAWLKPIKTEPMEQREPSSSLEWPSRDRGRRSQSRLRRYHQSATLRAETSSKDVDVEPCSPVCTLRRIDWLRRSHSGVRPFDGRLVRFE